VTRLRLRHAVAARSLSPRSVNRAAPTSTLSGPRAYPMKAYLVTTGILFAVITVAHVFEVVDRRRLFASDALILAVSVALSVWAWRLVRKAAP